MLGGTKKKKKRIGHSSVIRFSIKIGSYVNASCCGLKVHVLVLPHKFSC